MMREVVQTNNLTEFVGFYSGLYFLTRMTDKEAAKFYASVVQSALGGFTPRNYSKIKYVF